MSNARVLGLARQARLRIPIRASHSSPMHYRNMSIGAGTGSSNPFLVCSPWNTSTLRLLGGAIRPQTSFSVFPSSSSALLRGVCTAASNASGAAGEAISGSAGTAAGSTDGVGEATGVSGEGVETRQNQGSANDPPDDLNDNQQIGKLAAELQQSRDALSASTTKVRELQDKLLRCLAEQENARIRLTREVELAREYAVSGFAKAMLEVGDSLSYAKQSMNQQLVKQEGTKELNVDDIQKFVDGLIMTESLFHKTLERFGVEPYDPLGEKFDPAIHEALFEMQGPSQKNGNVAQVVQRGYKIKDRVLRAAKVGVVRGDSE